MLADLIPAVLSTTIERRKLTRAEIQARWLNKPGRRAKFNAYRRKWWAARKERGNT
jgi:hypothetical protein